MQSFKAGQLPQRTIGKYSLGGQSVTQVDTRQRAEEAIRVEHGPLTVAVIEDDASMRMSIQRLLDVSGFVAEGFASAEEFLDLRAESEFVCVVLDLDLPGMNGIQLMHELSVLNALDPIILITALDDDDLETAARRAGCVAYLRKPFAPQLLLKFVTEASLTGRQR